jgi:sigma-B regulation protein RsbU (phosphoserine phosphatase)
MIPESPATASPATTEPIELSTAQMKDVLAVSRLFAVTADLDSLLLKIAYFACSLLRCERGSIWLYDPDRHELYTKIILQAKQLRVPANSGIVGAAFNTNRVVTVHHAYEDPRFNPSSDKATGFLTRSLMAIPMVDIEGNPVGVIQAVNKIDGTFTHLDEALVQLLADQAGVAIQRHKLQMIAKEAAELQHEMSLARTVQQGLLPKYLPELPGYDLFGWAKAASTTGGDCYDLWQMSDGRLGIFLADASGHGLAPALVVSQARTLVRALCECLSSTSTPHDILARVNQRMSDDLDPGRFITAFLGFLNPDGQLQWQSAGHGPILLRPSADAPIQALEPAIPPINVLSELPDEFPPPMKLGPGGMLAVMSDGIFESFNPARELFGIERVLESLQNSHREPAAAAQALLKSVVDWQQHDQPTDDQTIILLNRKL